MLAAVSELQHSYRNAKISEFRPKHVTTKCCLKLTHVSIVSILLLLNKGSPSKDQNRNSIQQHPQSCIEVLKDRTMIPLTELSLSNDERHHLSTKLLYLQLF